MNGPVDVKPAEGKLGILIIGMGGAVATTFMAGCLLARRGLAKPIGSVTQMGSIRIGKRQDDNNPLLKEYVSLASLDDLCFGGWDLFAENAYDAAVTADVLKRQDLDAVADEMRAIEPMPAVFFPEYVRRLRGENIKTQSNKHDLAEALRHDIRAFKDRNKVARCVSVWCGSTEVHHTLAPVHETLRDFEQGLHENDPAISPSMVYAYACLQESVPYANGAPNLTCEVPALQELAHERRVPVSGKDFKTGQTLMKTMVAPGLKSRQLGIRGWFSTNILGNRDGEVLDDPESFKSKEVSKLGVLESILEPERNPDLYGDLYHKVRIEYYPPRGDQKEGWDNLDIFGWLGYPMQIKIDFLCRDSILAAPIVLDLALFMDLAARAGMRGTQDWLSFFYKSPMARSESEADNDLFSQLMRLKNTLRWMKGQQPIGHFGQEYYD